jgi:hypothetical protein
LPAHVLEEKRGDDVIDGGACFDTAVFTRDVWVTSREVLIPVS